MRVLRTAATLLLFALASPADADGPSLQLANLPGVWLFITSHGEKPCDYVTDRLSADAKFVLNTANISFHDGVDLPATQYALLEAVADSLNVGGACVWSLRISLSARVTGGTVLGSPYDGYTELWTGGSLGIHPGNGLTAKVSDSMQSHLRDMVNAIHESKRLFAHNDPRHRHLALRPTHDQQSRR
jgi:hypothetical protein